MPPPDWELYFYGLLYMKFALNQLPFVPDSRKDAHMQWPRVPGGAIFLVGQIKALRRLEALQLLITAGIGTPEPVLTAMGCSHELLLHVLAADEDNLPQVLDGNDQGLQALLASLQDGSKTRVYRRLPWHQHPTNSNPGSRFAILGGIA